jgi:hypothetical protein
VRPGSARRQRRDSLGFILLGKGDAIGARTAFATAKELGYGQDEILDANLACATYLLGDYATAAREFTTSRDTHVFRAPATLFAIGPTGLFPIEVGSAAAYAALMSLDAAWSAHRAGDEALAAAHLDAARLGEESIIDDAARQAFAGSVSALAALGGSP